MGPLLRELLRELVHQCLCAAGQGLEQWCTRGLQRLALERQRLFEGLLLLCLGLVLLSAGLAGLLFLAWWALPSEVRLPVMTGLLMALVVLGLAILAWAWRRWAAPG